MPDEKLLEQVTATRAKQALAEVHKVYPEASMSSEVIDGRGVITICQDRYVVSKEFIESEDTINAPGRMIEYARVLLGKSRLVVVVPKEMAARMWLRLLELNNFWLFYHQLHCYDGEGTVELVDRLVWRRLAGLPPELRERSLEVV